MSLKNSECPICPKSPKTAKIWPRNHQDDERCICKKPIWISIPSGKHIHCPVHPEVIIRGDQIAF